MSRKQEELDFLAFLIKNESVFIEFNSILKHHQFLDNNVRDLFELLQTIVEETQGVPTLTEAIWHLKHSPKALEGIWSEIELELKIKDLTTIYETKITNATKNRIFKFITSTELLLLAETIKNRIMNASLSDTKNHIQAYIRKLNSLVDLTEREDKNEFMFPLDPENVDKIPEVLGGIYDEDTIPTPFPRINKIIGGGLHKEELSLLVGLPGRGKTTTLLNLALHAAREGKISVYYSLDDSQQNILNRIYCHKSRLSSRYLNLNEFKDRVKENLQPTDLNFVLRCFPRRTISVAGIAADLDKVKLHLQEKLNKEVEIDLVCVDYLDELLLSYGAGRELRHKLDATTRDLGTLAGQKGVHVAAATQSNAKGLKSRVLDGGNLAEGFSKMFAPKFCWGICMDALQYKQGRFMLGIFKNTWGPNYLLDPCEVSWSSQIVKEVEEATLIPIHEGGSTYEEAEIKTNTLSIDKADFYSSLQLG